VSPAINSTNWDDTIASAEGDPTVARLFAELLRDGSATLVEDDGDEDYEDVEEDEEEDEVDEDEDIAMEPDDEEDDDDYAANILGYRAIRGTAPAQPQRWHDEVKEPKEEGLKLLFTGEFGRIQHQIWSRHKAGNAAKLLLNRGTKVRPPHREDFAAVSNGPLAYTFPYLMAFIGCHTEFRWGSCS
jgi:DDB1- and CUL4-associated factor 11